MILHSHFINGGEYGRFPKACSSAVVSYRAVLDDSYRAVLDDSYRAVLDDSYRAVLDDGHCSVEDSKCGPTSLSIPTHLSKYENQVCGVLLGGMWFGTHEPSLGFKGLRVEGFVVLYP